jgi:glycosyltransferase involved in cell wall biosynthesis
MNNTKNAAICVIRHDYYPDGHVSRDVEALAAAGYDTTVVALRRPGERGKDWLNGVQIHRLPVEHHRGSLISYAWEYLRFFVLAFLTVSLLHARKRFAIVEADNMPDVLVFAALLPKMTGARIILYSFDHMAELLTLTRGWSYHHPLVRLVIWLQRTCSSFADRVIITTETVRTLYVDRGVAPEKLRVVLNCPNETVFTDERLVAVPPEHAGLNIVTHGTILERFGIQVLIDALPEIAVQIPSVQVQIYGDGEFRANLEEQARRNGLASRVHFHGFVPQEQLVALLQHADIGYVGMLCDLMLSNKLMEYAALGIPIVGARWPTYEYYFPEDAVTYFPPGDARSLAAAILAIYRDPEAGRRQAERARALYEGYRWGVQRNIYLAIYDELLSAPAPQPAGVATPVASR